MIILLWLSFLENCLSLNIFGWLPKVIVQCFPSLSLVLFLLTLLMLYIIIAVIGLCCYFHCHCEKSTEIWSVQRCHAAPRPAWSLCTSAPSPLSPVVLFGYCFVIDCLLFACFIQSSSTTVVVIAHYQQLYTLSNQSWILYPRDAFKMKNNWKFGNFSHVPTTPLSLSPYEGAGASWWVWS